MNDKLFYMIFTDALNIADRDAFISGWALSSVWEEAEDAEIPSPTSILPSAFSAFSA